MRQASQVTLQDHERDEWPHKRIADFPAQSNQGCACDDAEGDEAVHAGMLSVGNEAGLLSRPSVQARNLPSRLCSTTFSQSEPDPQCNDCRC